LVLGGGGIAGIAWETGFLLGLRDAGVDVTNADRVIGTSAGSCVGAQVATGCDLLDLFERQLAPPPEVAKASGGAALSTVMVKLGAILMSDQLGTARLKAIGEFALEAETAPEAKRRAEIEARLPIHEWPDRDLWITAIDASTGIFRIFTPADAAEVGLVDAVAASCAVPGIRPAMTIGGTRYMDGGVRTTSNADLAIGCDVALVLAPLPDWPTKDPEILASYAELERTATVLTIGPDEASKAAIGTNPLDLATARPCALAARAQAAAHADEVAALWGSVAGASA
jgi:NTE family protein